MKLRRSVFGNIEWVLASDVDNMLNVGVEVHASHPDCDHWYLPTKYENLQKPAYRGVLINIEIIKNETAEDFLREIGEKWGTNKPIHDVKERVKRILEDK